MNKTINHFAPLFVIDMTPQSHWRFTCSLISWDTTVKWWETPPPPPQGSHHWVNGVNFACIGEKKQKFWWLQPQKCSHIWDRRSDIYSLLITKWSTTSNLLDNWQACWFNTGTGCWVCRNSASLDDPQKLLFCREELAGVQLTNCYCWTCV